MNILKNMLMVILLIASIPSMPFANAQVYPLPKRLSECDSVSSSQQSNEIRYRNCFSTDTIESYAAAYISFNNDDMNLESYIKSLDKFQKRDFFKKIGSLFVSQDDTVIVLVRITASPGGGQPDYVVGNYELMRIFKSDKSGTKFATAKSTYDGLQGATFVANSGSKVIVEISYVAERKIDSNIGSALVRFAEIAGGLGHYTGALEVNEKDKAEIKRLDGIIASAFNRNSKFYHRIDLSLDPQGTQAFFSRVTLGDILPSSSGGALHVAAIPIASVLARNPTNNSASLKYGDGGWDPSTALQITRSEIDSLSLSSHMRQALGPDYLHLSQSRNEQDFIQACKKLYSSLKDPRFSLSGNDVLAATWAFIADNPLLKTPSVRQNYCLSEAERAGYLTRLGMWLPPLTISLPSKYDGIVAAAQLSSARADDAEVASQQVVNSALTASSRAMLTPTPEGFHAGQVGGLKYTGQAMDPLRPFAGVAVVMFGEGKDSRYEGSLSLVGSEIVYEGLGRFTVHQPTGFTDFSSYSGEFQAYMFSGSGVMRWPNGREFKGQFAQDKANGFGVLNVPGNIRYYVRMNDNVPTGMSVREKDGIRAGGKWEADTFVAE